MVEEREGTVAFEVAVYRAADPDGLAARHGEVHDRLRGYDGHVHSLALRQVDAPEVFADVVVWRDRAAAEAAAAALGQDPALAWFGPAIAELRLFTHLVPASDPGGVVPALRAAPLVELAVYRPADPQAHAEVHRRLHGEALPGRDGVVASVALTGGEGGEVADVIGWSSRAAMAATQAALAPDPTLSALFDPDQDVRVVALFAPAP